MSGQVSVGNFSISGYQYVGEVRVSETLSQVTYSATLTNTGPAFAQVTATVNTVNPFSVRLVPGQGTLQFGPVPANGQVPSSNTFTLLVDRSVPFSWSNIQWSFQTVQAAPIANAGTAILASVGSTVQLNGTASSNPSGTGTLSYSWNFLSRPAGSSERLLNSTTPTPSFVVSAPGIYIIQLTVSNGVASSTASVTVSTSNVPPVANAGPNQSVNLGATVQLDGSGSTDPNGDTITYAWMFTSIPQGSAAQLIGANGVRPTFIADKAGNYVVELVVSDSKASSMPATVTISTRNSVPTADAGANQTVNPGAQIQLSGAKSTDPDGDPLTYHWTLVTKPNGSTASLSSSTAVNPTFTVDLFGTYVAQLIVNDGMADSQPASVTITTNRPQAPTANAGPGQTVQPNSLVLLGGSGTDPQGLPLTYQWSFLSVPAGSMAALTGATTQTPSFTVDFAGNYVVQLIVSNGFSQSQPATVTISTLDTPPSADAGPNQNVTVGAKVALNATNSTDPDHDTLTYSWSFTTVPSGSTAVFSDPHSPTPTFVANVAGVYVAQVVVSDGLSNVADTVTITAIGISLTPATLNLAPNDTKDITVTIPVQAGPQGIIVGLTSPNPGLITFPDHIFIPQGSSTASFSVTAGTSTGLVTILANYSGSGLPNGQVTISVGQPFISVSLDSTTIAVGSTANGTITLTPSPTIDTTVSITSHSANVADVEPGNPQPGIGDARVTISRTTGTGTFTATGMNPGQTSITVSSAGYTTGQVTLTVNTSAGPLKVATTALNNGQVGVQYAQALAATGGTAPYSWSVVSGTLPSGLTMNAAGQITGVPSGNVTTSASLTFKVTDTTTPTPQSATASLTLNIIAPLSVTTTSLPTGSVGAAYSQNLAAAGGTSPYTWQLTNGTLPAGLTLSPSGQISGTPTASASGVALTFKVTDSTSPSAQTTTATLTLTINASLAISTTSLASGKVGTVYTQTLAATGGSSPYSWSLTAGTLPAGLTLSSAGQLSGTPTAAASGVALTFKVTDSGNPAQSATANLSLTIVAPLSITTTSLPNGVVGTAYNQALAATGGTTPYTWSLTGPTSPSGPVTPPLPAGLTLSSSGQITGTPTTASVATIFVMVTDSSSPAQTNLVQLTLTVNSGLTITTASLANGIVGKPYTQNLAAGGGANPYTWTLSSGTLPAGLTLSSSGLISGTPTATASNVALTFKVQDSASPSQSTTANLTLSIVSALSATTASLPNGVVGVAYNQSLAATGGVTPYSWSLTSGSLPAGLTLSSSGQISGTPTATASAAPLTFKVTDSTNPAQAATVNLTLTIGAALSVSSASLPNGVVGMAYNQTLTATGGTSPYTWSLTSGTLPAGLTLSPSGQITGTPTAAASAVALTFKVTDSSSPALSTSVNLSLTVVGALTVTTNSLSSGAVGTAYNQSLAANGGTTPYTWSLTSGTLPAGLTFSSSGQIAGTPSAVASVSLTFKVTDSGNPAQTANATLTLTIVSPVSVTTNSLPNGVVGTAYTQALAAGGGTSPYSWSLTAGTLPAGLTLSSSGQITGTPTAAASAVALTLKVTDSTNPAQSATATLNLTIVPAVSVTTSSLPNGVVGKSYTQALAATGGTSPYTWSLISGTLPAGLTFSSSGQISGTPTAAASAVALTFKVTDSGVPSQSVTATLNLTIVPALAVSTASLPSGVVGGGYTQSLAATGGVTPYAWSLTTGTLPAGLTLSSAGQISGTPTATASAIPLSFKVTDSSNPAQTASVSLTLTITAGLSISTQSLPNGAVGLPYSQALAATGGTTPYSWSLASGTLPAGLTLSGSGQLTGTPTAAVTAVPLTFRVTDSTNPVETATANVTLTILPALSTTTASLPSGVVGKSYSQTLTASGGVTPYTWSLTSGTLPAGLTFSSAGQISGTPTTAVTGVALTFKVTDSGNPAQSATANLTLTINTGLSITTASLPNAVVGSAYNQSIVATGGTTPYAWSLTSGTLPAGLTLASSGQITGTPSAAASAVALTFKVTDSSNPAQSATVNLNLTVVAGLAVQTNSLPNGVVGTLYNSTLTVAGGVSPYSWSLTGGALPAGLTVSSSGVISGAPSTAASNLSATFKVTDAENPTQSATATLTITILPVLTVTTSALPSGSVGVAYNQSLAASGGATPYTWSLTSGSLPAGLTLSPSGQITGTPTTAASGLPLTFKVTDSGNPAQSVNATLSLTIVPALAVTTSSLPNGVVGTAYSQALAATGGTSPYTWSLTSGALPAGMTLSPAGQITGTPTASATGVALTFKVTDSAVPALTATVNLSLTILAKLSVTTSSLPNGVVGTAYNQTLTATGGTTPYTWSLTSGTLPAGLTLSSSGQISGSPTATASNVALTFKVTDASNPALSATAVLNLTVASALSITTSSLPGGTVGVAYNQTLGATGGTTPYTWSLSSGTLPAGLTFSSAGQITGTPTAAASGVALTFKVTDSGTPAQSTSVSLSLTIGQALAISTTSLPNAIVGTAYNQSLTAIGGNGPYTWSLTFGILPSGLTLSSGGQITGTASIATTAPTLTFKVTDSSNPTQSATVQLSLTVVSALTITSANLPNGTVGSAYNVTLQNNGGGTSPYTWSLTSGTLPAGLTFSSAGQLSGTPTVTAAAVPLSFKVTDSGNPVQSATATLTLTISSGLTITTTSLNVGTVGTAYSQALTATGGNAPYNWSIAISSANQLPSGLTLSQTGQITGTPQTAVTSIPITFSVTDTGFPAHTATAILNLTINPIVSGNPITITGPGSGSIGVFLQASYTVTLPQTATADTNVSLTITSNAAFRGVNGVQTQNLNATISQGQNSATVLVQGVAVGSATMTAAVIGSSFPPGNATITVTPSAFILTGPNGNGVGFPTNVGSTSNLTISSARLNGTGAFAEFQPVGLPGSNTVTVTLQDSNAAAGSTSQTSFTFGTADASFPFTLTGLQQGNVTLTAAPPAGFATPSDNTNAINITVNPAGLILFPSLTLGKNLQAAETVSLNGIAQANTTVTISSADSSKLVFSTDPTLQGVQTIQVTIPANGKISQVFYVQALGSTGTVNYTANASGIGQLQGTVTLAFGGLQFTRSDGIQLAPNNQIPAGVSVPFALVPVYWTAANTTPVPGEIIRGGLFTTITLNNSNSGAGSLSPTSITYPNVTNTISTTFQASQTPSSTVLSWSDADFSTPSINATVNIQVTTGSIHASFSSFSLGSGLQVSNPFSVFPSQTNLQVTVTSTSPNLLLAVNEGDVGKQSITLTLSTTQGSFWTQAFGPTGQTYSYTISAPGYSSLTNNVTVVAPSIQITPQSLSETVAGGAKNLQLTAGTQVGNFFVAEDIAPTLNDLGLGPVVTLTNSAPGVVTIPAQVQMHTGNFNTNQTLVTVTPAGAGTATVTVNQPAGYTNPTVTPPVTSATVTVN